MSRCSGRCAGGGGGGGGLSSRSSIYRGSRFYTFAGRAIGRMAATVALLLLLPLLLLEPAAGAARTKAPPSPPPCLPGLPGQTPAASRPNFVIIITDDQDEVLNSTHPAYMPALNSLLGSRGTRFVNTIVSTSVCCPARVSILTGRLAHCTNITANWAPMGAWKKFSRLGLDSDWLPGWLQEAGYRTGLVGKLLNGFTTPLAAETHCPLGFDYLDALTEAGLYTFYNSTFALNCGPSERKRGQYQTDIIRDKALTYIDKVATSGKPFYLHVTPAAPHRNYRRGGGWQPPLPALRHAHLYPNLTLPFNPTFLKANPLNPDDTLDMRTPTNIQDMTNLYVGRLRALRAVDEMVDAIVSKLSDLGILNNTYIFYTSDNGMHMGQHALAAGKATPIEEDSRVPLYVRGPGVVKGLVSAYQANLIDIAPTIRILAGLPLRPDLDGLPLPLEGLTMEAYGTALQLAGPAPVAQWVGMLLPSPPPSPLSVPSISTPPYQPYLPRLSSPPPSQASTWLREAILLEAWDSAATGGFFPGITYKGLRLCSTYQADLKAPPGPPTQRRPPSLSPLSPPPFASSNPPSYPAFWMPQRPSPLLSAPPLQEQPPPAASRQPALMVPQPHDRPPVYCLKYVVWCTDNQRELYDLSHDPYEAADVLSFASAALLSRLDAVLSVLVHCRGADCTHPYRVLHPGGDVLTFEQAMEPRHDALYASLPRFTFATCYPGYVPPNERTFTLGMRGFPANVSWESTGIIWPLPPGVKGITMEAEER